MNFHVAGNSGQARTGELQTPHGAITTPVFMPVATQGSVKALCPGEVSGLGFAMLLSNTYHLYLRPGIAVIEQGGGLHKFMGWNGAILTDSGGYQVFSLSSLRKVTEEGVTFRSHIDGSQHVFTPELAVRYQESLGSDIAMVLDECPPPDASPNAVREATARTNRWAERCKRAQRRTDQALFAIAQGGLSPELRRESAKYLASLDFPGYAIGGLSLGETKSITYSLVTDTLAALPENRPRYLMGVGSPEDIVECVGRGVDIFDSALPTRIARNGALFTSQGRIDIRNAAYRQAYQPVDTGCSCYTCRNFTGAYLHHLFRARELLAYRLATIHNLAFISDLMAKIRDSIRNGSYDSFRKEFLAAYRTTDEEVRLSQKEKWLKTKSPQA